MPPSGFNQKAINGLLEFMQANYESVLKNYEAQAGVTQEEFLRTTSERLENSVRISALASPLELSKEGLTGLVIFITECYTDLAAEINAGQDNYSRPVSDTNAIQKELSQIKAYLAEFKI